METVGRSQSDRNGSIICGTFRYGDIQDVSPECKLTKSHLVFLLLAALCSLERVLATRRLTDDRIDCRIGGYRYFGFKAYGLRGKKFQSIHQTSALEDTNQELGSQQRRLR